MSDITKDAILAIAALGTNAEAKRIHTLPNGATIVANADTYQLLIDPTQDDHGLKLKAPSRIKKSLTVQDADSLVDYIVRFKTDGTVLFADIAHNNIRAVLDYHTNPTGTAHAEHIATLSLPFSEEWKAWKEKHGKLEGQLEFARFLRENAADVKAPDAASLIEIVKDIQAIRNVNFTRAVRLNSDNENFEFVDDTKTTARGGSVAIPDEFKLQLPVYFNGRTTELGAFLRHKLDDGKLLLGLNLHRAEHVRQAIFKEIVSDIAARADVPAYYASL